MFAGVVFMGLKFRAWSIHDMNTGIVIGLFCVCLANEDRAWHLEASEKGPH